jgi:type II secretory pathway pseudopilin PulG
MNLRGQGAAGYAMAALLVGLAVMAVMMTVALPVWRHEAQRRKEDELIWRGNQYVRAIRLYQYKFSALPPGVDVLVEGHFLRKKYKDPITNDDFDLLGGGTTQPGLAPGRGKQSPGAPGRGIQGGSVQVSTTPTGGMTMTGTPAASNTPNSSGSGTVSLTNGTVPGGLTGVRSKSKDESIKIYQGRTHYNEWVFMFVGQQPGMPGGMPGRGGTPGGPQRGQPGERGQNPNGFPQFPPGGNFPPRGNFPRNGPNGTPGPIGPGPNGPGVPQTPPGFPQPPGTGRGGRGL